MQMIRKESDLIIELDKTIILQIYHISFIISKLGQVSCKYTKSFIIIGISQKALFSNLIFKNIETIL